MVSLLPSFFKRRYDHEIKNIAEVYAQRVLIRSMGLILSYADRALGCILTGKWRPKWEVVLKLRHARIWALPFELSYPIHHRPIRGNVRFYWFLSFFIIFDIRLMRRASFEAWVIMPRMPKK